MDLISKIDAITRGLKFYFTGVTCRNGHINKRYVSTGGCIQCAKKHPVIARAYVVARRAAKLNRTPSWLTKDDKSIIKDMYVIASRVSKETGIKRHVDHIIPLQGKLVSGLHTPINLQLLTAKANLTKGNYFAVN